MNTEDYYTMGYNPTVNLYRHWWRADHENEVWQSLCGVVLDAQLDDANLPNCPECESRKPMPTFIELQDTTK